MMMGRLGFTNRARREMESVERAQPDVRDEQIRADAVQEIKALLEGRRSRRDIPLPTRIRRGAAGRPSQHGRRGLEQACRGSRRRCAHVRKNPHELTLHHVGAQEFMHKKTRDHPSASRVHLPFRKSTDRKIFRTHLGIKAQFE